MVRNAQETVQQMARTTGGVIKQLGGRPKAEKVEATATQPGIIALHNITQGTTSHARMLVRGGVRITFGATPLLAAGITAVQKL